METEEWLECFTETLVGFYKFSMSGVEECNIF